MADNVPAWAETIIAAHTAVTDAVSHSEFLKSERYFVWDEDGANDLGANNVHAEHAVSGTTELFTKREFDPWAKALGKSFDAHGVAWSYDGCTHEEDTGFYHHSWVWEVA